MVSPSAVAAARVTYVIFVLLVPIDLYNNERWMSASVLKKRLNCGVGRDDGDLDPYEDRQHGLPDELFMNIQHVQTKFGARSIWQWYASRKMQRTWSKQRTSGIQWGRGRHVRRLQAPPTISSLYYYSTSMVAAACGREAGASAENNHQMAARWLAARRRARCEQC